MAGGVGGKGRAPAGPTVRGPQRVDGARPAGREDAWERDERLFQQTLRRAFIDHELGDAPTRARRDVAVGFDERVIVSGSRADEALSHMKRLSTYSPTFRGALERAFADHDTVWIRIGSGGGHSWSTIGARDEQVYINLEQGDLLDLLIHECGHALAKLEDGPLGGFGPNQRFQAMVKREMDMARGGVAAYGTEVRAEREPRGPRPGGRSGG